jgi:hypothetical protein
MRRKVQNSIAILKNTKSIRHLGIFIDLNFSSRTIFQSDALNQSLSQNFPNYNNYQTQAPVNNNFFSNFAFKNNGNYCEETNNNVSNHPSYNNNDFLSPRFSPTVILKTDPNTREIFFEEDEDYNHSTFYNNDDARNQEMKERFSSYFSNNGGKKN